MDWRFLRNESSIRNFRRAWKEHWEIEWRTKKNIFAQFWARWIAYALIFTAFFTDFCVILGDPFSVGTLLLGIILLAVHLVLVVVSFSDHLLETLRIKEKLDRRDEFRKSG